MYKVQTLNWGGLAVYSALALAIVAAAFVPRQDARFEQVMQDAETYWQHRGYVTHDVNITHLHESDCKGPSAAGCATNLDDTCEVWLEDSLSDYSYLLAAIHEYGHCLDLDHNDSDEYGGAMRSNITPISDAGDDDK